MGIEFKFPMAFSKAQITENQKFPLVGTTFLSLSDFTKPRLPAIANRFIELGFTIVATTSTTNLLKMEGILVERVLKLHEECPHVDDMISNGQIQLVVTANSGDALDQIDGRKLRRMELAYKIPIITIVSGALASVQVIKSMKKDSFKMIPLQDFFNTQESEGTTQELQASSIC